MFKIKVFPLSFFLIVVLSGLISHTIVPLPPTVFLVIMGLFLWAATRLEHREFSISSVSLIPILLVLFLTVTQILRLAPFASSFGVLFGILYFAFFFLISKELSPDFVDRNITRYINYSVVILLIEAIWRFTHPNLHYEMFDGVDDRWIYKYKTAGLMYSDSNGVCIHLLILYFFTMYWSNYLGKKWIWKKLILLVLIGLTFSRAGWIATVAGLTYYYFYRGKSLKFYVYNLVFSIISIVVVVKYYLLPKIETDLSFNTKFKIFEKILDHFSDISIINLLIGVGFSNSTKALGGIYAHNFLLVILMETGILGFFGFALLFYHFYKVTGTKALIILIPLFVVTLSASLNFIPYFYISMAVMAAIHKRNKA